MIRKINLQIEKLPEGMYLATSDDIQGLLAQGRTISETLEIARDVAIKLLELENERKNSKKYNVITEDKFEHSMIFEY